MAEDHEYSQRIYGQAGAGGTLRRGLRAESHHIEHHHAHLASAFLVSGFEEAACLSVDGFGDFASTALSYGRVALSGVGGDELLASFRASVKYPGACAG
ncbi:MAG: carbamoyltransferase N-terminal domain-containing protein [Chthoniobacterales bacterium]